MNAKQAASLAGLAPVTRQFLKLERQKLYPARTVRSAPGTLYALVAIPFHPQLKAKCQAMREVEKPAKPAIVAIMRKLVVIANALLRDERKWTLEVA